MNDVLKKGFFLGIGAAAAGREKVEQYVNDLVYKGRLTPKEAEEWVEMMVAKGEETEQEWTEANRERLQEMLKDAGFATQKEVSQLETRIAELEAKLNENSSSEKTDS
ncbi:polyhydroxyalkanoate synthesis regulator phasin [Salsuginibacillus halophilus]|uniref:Polyhydroxyalkanoate synthesis regulator phasin n=1 Tax=Salsuginibacillus halophilus TaxID=517424 RepID=A0A2P8HWI6_9BACI|nr:hypothetical protein [Salsuginibacillus halophilus]PSL50548.1 polyhydroxyalkanoate synthesis regulator phasin [Salsuginibacillus halophilus]